MAQKKPASPSSMISPDSGIRSVSQLGNALSRFRKMENWTQSQTSEQSGIKQSMVSQMEAGRSGIRLATLFKLVSALNLEIVLRKRKKDHGT